MDQFDKDNWKLIRLHPELGHKKSDNLRKSGNTYYNDGNNFAALMFYNKALLYAASDNVRIALCYANRSAVYLDMGFYKFCLHNIDLSEPHYPRNKIQKLYERREKCSKMMENSEDKMKMMQPFRHQFELSYEPNPRLPFFINALESREDESSGQHLITARELKAGDVIAFIDKPWYFPFPEVREGSCYNCTTVNCFNLSFGSCKNVLLCSEACINAHKENSDHHSALHEIEDNWGKKGIMTATMFMKLYEVFGNSMKEMKMFVEMHENKRYNVFDFNWSDPNDPMYYKNMLLVIFGFQSENRGTPGFESEMNEALNIFSNFVDCLDKSNDFVKIMAETQNEKAFRKTILWKIMEAYECRNEFRIEVHTATNMTLGMFFHPSIMILNHSCDPNIIIHVTNDKKLVWIVNQPIPAGGQIFINYTPAYYFTGRFVPSFSNTCQAHFGCIPCQFGWPDRSTMKEIMRQCIDNMKQIFKTEEDARNYGKFANLLESCYDFINKNFTTNYYQNKSMMKMIAMKQLEIRTVLRCLEDPLPPADVLSEFSCITLQPYIARVMFNNLPF